MTGLLANAIRGRVGLVVDGTDHFVRPIEAAMRARYVVDRFLPRFVRAPIVGTSINKVLLDLQMRRFLLTHEVVLFEWAGSLLVRATNGPRLCKTVTRLHSIEVSTAAHLVNWSAVDATIVVSRQMGQRLQKVVGGHSSPIHVVHQGVNLRRFHPSSKVFAFRLGMLARVVPIKRVYEVLLAVYELRGQGHPFTLSVAGPLGEDADQRYSWALQELIERLGIEESVKLLGPISNPENFYNHIDVFVSNSYWEGQQNALLEALASGCYCLSHCWGGAEEVLPPAQIFVTESEFRAKLLAFAALSQAERSEVQSLGRRTAEEGFDENRMVRECIEVIEDVRRA